jgi:hypothetical protein
LGAERDDAYRALLARSPNGRGAARADTPQEAGSELAARLRNASRREPEQALAATRDLLAEHPGYDQAHLLAARSLERLARYEEALEYAESVDPSPIYADLFAEVKARTSARVRPEERERHVETLRSTFRRARMARLESPL